MKREQEKTVDISFALFVRQSVKQAFESQLEKELSGGNTCLYDPQAIVTTYQPWREIGIRKESGLLLAEHSYLFEPTSDGTMIHYRCRLHVGGKQQAPGPEGDAILRDFDVATTSGFKQ